MHLVILIAILHITYHKFINVIYCKSLNKNFLNLSIQNPQSIDKTQLPVNMENKFKTTKNKFLVAVPVGEGMNI